MSNNTTGVLLALFSAAGFATLPIFIKISYSAGINTNTMLTLRFALSVLLLIITLKIRGISPHISIRQAGYLCLLGAIGFASTSLTFTQSLQYLPASLTTIVFHIYPTLVALLSFLTGTEKLNRTAILALVLCFIGLLLVVGISFTSINLIGIILAAVSALLYAIYAVAGNRVNHQVHSLVVTLYICIASTIVFGLAGIVQGDLYLNLSPSSWLTMLEMALFATLIGIFGFFTAMSRIGPTKTCIISTTEPVITVLLALWLLGEHIDIWQVTGGLLIISSIIILQF